MHRLARLAVGSIAVVALAACSSSGGAPSAGGGDPCSKSTGSGTVQAGIANFAFSPATVTAKVGDSITWTNSDKASHTVTVDGHSSCDTGSIASGSTGSLTFTAAGTYPFHCSIHPSMKGSIQITG